MYKIVYKTSFNEIETDKAETEEEIKECLESRKLLTKHIGYPIREVGDGFDLFKSKESQVVVGHYRIVEDND